MRLQKTESLLAHLAAENTFDSYAVCVGYKGDEHLLTSPNVNLDTLFDIASIGKVVVTTPLIFQAIDEGKLSLDTALSAFWSDLPEEKAHITVKQLLTHTSGVIRHDFSAEVASHNNDYIARHILSYPLGYIPGSNYVYSCSGFILLGFILEKIYGKTLDELFYLKVKAPLALPHATFNIPLDAENAAVCYRWNDNRLRRMDDELVSVMRGGVAGNGGEFWSMKDLQRYILALMNHSPLLFSRAMYDAAECDYTPTYMEGRGLGYLFVDARYAQTGNLFPVGSFGHCGHCGQSFFINRDMDLYVIILTNATRHASMKNDFRTYDYRDVMNMRALIHNSIKDDLLN